MIKRIKQIPLICQELKQLRKQQHLTQSELAQQLNVSLSTLQGIEQGKDRPSKELAKVLTCILGIDAAQCAEFERRLREETLVDDADIWYERANEAFDSGNYDLALTNYQNILSHAVSVDMKGFAYRGIGRTFYRKTEFAKAIEAFSSAIQHLPRMTRLYFERGLAYRTIAQYEQAVADYTYLIQHPPIDCSASDLAFVYYARAVASYNKGDFATAIADLMTAIPVIPDYGWAYYFRGLAYRRIGDLSNALVDFQQVLHCHNESGDSWRASRQQLNELFPDERIEEKAQTIYRFSDLDLLSSCQD